MSHLIKAIRGPATPGTFMPLVQRLLKVPFCPLPSPPRGHLVWRRLWLSRLGRGCPWHPVGGGRDSARQQTKDRTAPQERTTRPEVPTVPRLSATSPASQQEAPPGLGAPARPSSVGRAVLTRHTSHSCSLGEGSGPRHSANATELWPGGGNSICPSFL